MKKLFLILTVTGMIYIFTASILISSNTVVKKNATPETTSSIPDDLQLIFKKSCMDCHATGGSHRAMSMLNFTGWDKYKPGKQARKAGAICNIISKGSMPPRSFREANPEAVPTAAQNDAICEGSKAMKKKK